MRNPLYCKGDIVYNKVSNFHYLIVDQGIHEGDVYYKSILLEYGEQELLGYWDYMLREDWALWA